MAPDAMTVRLHLRRVRVLAVLVDPVEQLVVAVEDLRRVVRCPHCGFKTAVVHDRREVKVYDVAQGRPTTLRWCRRRCQVPERANPRNAEIPRRKRGFRRGRYWDRTSDLCRVKAALSR